MRRSFKLITLFDIPIEINYTWFIILGLIIFTLAEGYFPATNPELPGLAHWLLAAVAAIFLFASLLAHELSHSLVAKKNNLPIHGITLFVFGGVAHLEKEPSTPEVELKMAAAGPAMSFSLAVVFFSLTQTFNSFGAPDYVVSLCNYLFIINLVVGLFNLIPGFPLDGGRILRAIIWHFTNNLRKATGIASGFGKGFAFFLIGVGFLNLFSGSFISGIWLIFIGFFLQEAAEVSYRQVVMRKILTGVRVENIMTRDVITVPSNITLNEMLEKYFLRFRFASFPVIHEDRLVGLITLHDIKEIEREKWPGTLVREAMIPLTEALIIDKKSEVTEALAKMAAGGIGRLLVIEDSKLIGILSQKDILRLFEFKSEIEEAD